MAVEDPLSPTHLQILSPSFEVNVVVVVYPPTFLFLSFTIRRSTLLTRKSLSCERTPPYTYYGRGGSEASVDPMNERAAEHMTCEQGSAFGECENRALIEIICVRCQQVSQAICEGRIGFLNRG